MPLPKKERTFYRHILSDAWRITWRRKELLVFGFFATLAWGGGAINYVYDMTTRMSSGAPFTWLTTNCGHFMSQFASPIQAVRITAIVCLIISIVLFAALALASVTSIGAILNAAAKYEAGQPSNLRQDLTAGGRYFWRIFGITVACRAIAIVFLIIVGLTFAAYTYITPFFWCLFIILFAAAGVAAVFLWFISGVASAAVAVDNLGWLEALADAYELLVKHWLISLETSVILFVATIVAALAVIVTTIVASLPFTALLFAASFVKSSILMYIVIVLGTAVGLAIIATIGSALSVFTQATWALLYSRLGARGASAKLERIFLRLKALHAGRV